MNETTEAIYKILKDNNIDPNKVIDTDNGERTAFQIMEAAVYGAMEETD